MKKVTCISYHGTGSGAVDDLLKEFDNFASGPSEFEFRLLHDPDGISEYEMLAGHHRKAAAVVKGFDTIPCIIVDAPDNVHANAITAITNKQREELSTMEKAYIYSRE